MFDYPNATAVKHIFFSVFLLATLAAGAQVDTKLNAGSLLFGGLAVSAELPLGERSTLGLGAAYSSVELTINDENTYRHRNARLIPEYRYYFSPGVAHAGSFAGAYGKYGRLNGTNLADDTPVSTTRLALGLMGGYKWVRPSGFLFELNAGAGRATTFGADDSAEDRAYEAALGLVTTFDLRLGILVGWRF